MIPAVLGLAKAVPLAVWGMIALGAWGAYNRHDAKAQAQARIEQAAEFTRERERQMAASVTESQRRIEAQQEILNGAQLKASRLAASVVAGASARDRLQRELAARDGACVGSAGAAASVAAAASAADLRAVVRGRLDEAADRIAEYADRAALAAETCGEQYESLSKKKP